MRMMISMAAALAAALAAVPASANGSGDFRTWLTEAIDANMVFPGALQRSHANGVATVRFRVDGTGRPADVTIVESSGNRALDRAALRTIASLELPADAPFGAHFAVLQYGTEASFADSRANEERMTASVDRALLAAREVEAQRRAFAGRSASGAASTID